jgi:hypothetical protein
LPAHGIVIRRTGGEQHVTSSELLDVVDGVLFDFDACEPSVRSHLLLDVRQRKLFLVALHRDLSDRSQCYAESLDAIAPFSSGSAALAAALFSAQKQAKTRYQLEARIDGLETEIVQAALVERAAIVLAKQSQSSQGEGLRLLRGEARRQRRPMWELAKVVLAADDILSQRSARSQSQ